jgi:hypothetical protein
MKQPHERPLSEIYPHAKHRHKEPKPEGYDPRKPKPTTLTEEEKQASRDRLQFDYETCRNRRTRRTTEEYYRLAALHGIKP